jgi:hypothetical protein
MIGVIFFWFISYVERLLIPWHSSVRTETLGL